MEKDYPFISVIIPCYNAKAFLERCLNSLFSEKGSDFEVILVDDGSNDGTLELVKDLSEKEPGLKLINLGKNSGAAAAKNAGARESQGQYLFFLDADTKVKDGWFKAITDFFANHPESGLAQAKLLKMNSDIFDCAGDLMSNFGFLVERSRNAKDQGQFNTCQPIFSLKTAGAVIRKDVFENIGGFDANYHIFWEDTDLAWRAWLSGWQVLFCPDLVVWHAYGTPEKTDRYYQDRENAYRIVYFGCRNHLITLIKNLGLKKMILVLPIVKISWFTLAILSLLSLKFNKGLSILNGLWANLSSLPQTLQKRKQIQKTRRITDQELFAIVGTKKNLGYYLGKAMAYVQGKPF
jgi:hypothetical protein